MNKRYLLIGGMWLAIVPWLAGGREPLAPLISFGAVLIASFIAWRLPEGVRLRSDPLMWSATAFLIWSSLSLIWSVNRFQSIEWIVGWVMVMALFMLAQQVRSKADQVRLWLGGYVSIATVFSLYGIWLYLVGDYERLTSTIYWANPYAAYLIPAVILSGWMFARGKQWTAKWQWLAGLATVINGTAFALTGSRGAILVLALVSLMVIIWRRPKLHHCTKIVFSLIMIIIATFGLQFARQHHFQHATVVSNTSRFAEAARGESNSLTDRRNYIETAIGMWRNEPLRGTGAGTFASVQPAYQKRVISATTDAHNAYLQRLPELGLVGFLILAAVMITLALGLWRCLRQDAAKWPLVVALAGLLIHFGLDIDARYPVLLALAAILAGLCYAPRPSKPGQPTGMILLLLVCAALPVFGAYRSATYADFGGIAQDNHDYSDAAGWYQKAHGTLVYDPDTLTGEGINYLSLAAIGIDPAANLKLAETSARSAVKLDPRDAQHEFLLAQVLRLEGDGAGSVGAYLEALRLDPLNHPEYYLGLAELYASQQAPDKALIYTRKVIELYPPEVVANRGAQADIGDIVARAAALQAALAPN
jgi:O-antigen ligase